MSFRYKLDAALCALLCSLATQAGAQDEAAPESDEATQTEAQEAVEEPGPTPTREGLVGRWVVTNVNGQAVAPDLVMVLELTDDGESFMDVGGDREPSGDWAFDSDGTAHHLTQTTPDGETVANQLTMPTAEELTLSSPDGFALSFAREGSAAAAAVGPSDPTAAQIPVETGPLIGTWVAGPSPTAGTALEPGTTFAMQPDGSLAVTHGGTTTAGHWRAFNQEGIDYVELAPDGAEPMQLAFVMTPEGNITVMAPDGMIYPLGRSE